jgi:hypothetical protein
MTARGYRRWVGARILVNLKSGNAIAGVLWSTSRGVLVLKGAELLEPGESPVRLDGEAIIGIGEVDFAQVANP